MSKSLISCLAVLVVAAAGCSSKDNNGKPSGSGGGGDVASIGDGNGGGDSESGIPGWHCNADYYGTDDGCDCGCGLVDPDCTDGCAAVGCGAASCQYCYDETGQGVDQCPAPPLPSGWTCDSALWGDSGCDCGCGVEDFDCYAGSCTTPGCKADVCDLCHNGASVISCAPDGWLCSQAEWQDTSCDCGCGLADESCYSGGCTVADCKDNACDVCHAAAGAVAGCAPRDWTCTEDEWQDYGCDCGCGVPDKGCGDAASCTTAGCLANSCDVCHNGATPVSCVPPTFTCGEDAWFDYTCDCGCGAEDRGCTGGAGSCSTPGCLAPSCDICHNNTTEVSCMPREYTCGPEAWDDFSCDCGCGAVDHGCLAGSCTAAGCKADVCEICHDGVNVISCLPTGWTCPESYWVDNSCDCGCGAPDAHDCGAAGCSTPGCTATGCQYCWDTSTPPTNICPAP
ncbi:MAG: hypothetical protein HY903_12675 [Deltaproteobacteria bacterium]|nr:hypothetical protein [Deltaproteobacteria bacterium]